MRVFIFSDIHGDVKRAKEITGIGADVFILAGDVSDLRDGLDEMGDVLKPLGNALWVMPGNNEHESDVKQLCEKHGFQWFHDTLIEKEGYSFFGLGYSNYTPFGTPGERSEDTIAKALEKAQGAKNLIIASHAPPYGTSVDLTRSGVHTGSRALCDFVIKEEPIMVLCGHIHENAGKIGVLGKTTLFSVGKGGVLLDL
jgi:hypothetical protein